MLFDVDTSLPAARVVAALEQLAALRVLPQSVVVDNGPEFIQARSTSGRTGTAFSSCSIAQQTNENAYIESVHSRFRYECLSAHWFFDVADARLQIEHFRRN